MNPPCKDCTFETGRYPGCHDHCDKPEYLKWREEKRVIREKERLERQCCLDYNSMKSKHIERTRRKYNSTK